MRYYVICSTPRSGSTLLTEALAVAGAGKADEYLNPVIVENGARVRQENFLQPTVADFIERIKQKYTVNDIFGIKIHYWQLANAPEFTNQPERFFPNAQYIAITRRNILRQAVSISRAMQTKAWRSYLPEVKQPRFRYFSILKYLILSAGQTECWEKFYAAHNIKPLRVFYEDLESDYENTMRKVFSFLGIDAPIPPPLLKKQSDELTEIWLERFCETYQGRGIGDSLSRLWKQLSHYS